MRAHSLTLQRSCASQAFAEMLCDLLAQLRPSPTPEKACAAIDLLALGRQLGVEAVSPRAQEQLWELLSAVPERPPELESLAVELGFGSHATVPADIGAPASAEPAETENAIDPASTSPQRF